MRVTKKKNHVKDFGGSGEVIVLLHGFLSSSKYWTKLQPHLSDAGYRVVTIDLLGFGDAPKPNDITYSYGDHTSHIHSVIHQLNITKPFILIGHSMGALIAARYAKIFNNTVSSLVLLHPPLYKNAAQARSTLRDTGIIYRFLLDSRFRRLGWSLMKTFMWFRIAKHSRQSRERSLKNIIEAAEIFDDLDIIHTPTMLLVGLKDRPEYMENVTRSNFSNAVIVVKEDVNHHSPILHPLLLQEKIACFIDQVV